jgi:hypothetical protein
MIFWIASSVAENPVFLLDYVPANVGVRRVGGV